jgi:Na+-transporting NADH:ubiquinone oxidoreductase subunit NqrF
MIKKYLPEASDDTLFLICGPKPMNKLVLNILKKINVKPENIHKF